jgi:hypothetical protein
MFEIFKSKQGFNSFDLIGVVASITAIVAISGPIVYRGIQSGKIEFAKQEISKLVQEPEVLLLAASARRGPSNFSEPTTLLLKSDPWGRPYQAQILKNSYGQNTHLVVWSLGPNNVLDTPAMATSSQSGSRAVAFQGDDIGYVVPLR